MNKIINFISCIFLKRAYKTLHESILIFSFDPKIYIAKANAIIVLNIILVTRLVKVL